MSRPLKSIRCEHVRIWVLFHWCFTSVSLSGQKSAQSTANYALCTPSARETHSRLAALPIPSAHGPREISGESRTWRLLTCAFVPFPEHIFLQCRSLKKKGTTEVSFFFYLRLEKHLNVCTSFFPAALGKATPTCPQVKRAQCSSVATFSYHQQPRVISGWIQSLSANCRGRARGAGRTVTQIYAQKWICNMSGKGDSNMCVVEGEEPPSLLIPIELDRGLMLLSKGQALGREAAAEYSNKWLVSEECPAVSMEQPCHFSANSLRTLRKEDKMSAALLGLPLRV